MNWTYIRRKLIRKLRLGGLFYYFYNITQPKDCIVDYDLKDLEEYVSSIHPDTGGGCLCENTIEEPSCDLQIIVPVYNVEKYLRECVESILNQKTDYTYHVVIVNDGSTDGSREILEEYSTDSRITIIDKENGGLSSARNAALKKIYGKYITFVDSDDRLPQGAVQALMKIAMDNSSDIVRGSYFYFRQNGKITPFICKSGKTTPFKTVGIACGVIYRASIWKNICFPNGYWYEDTNCFLISSLAEAAWKIDDVVYEYRMNSVGITHIGIGNKKSIDSFYVTRRVLTDIKELGKIDCQELYECMLHQLVTNFIRIVDLGNSKLDKAVFLLSCDIIESYFPKMQSKTAFGKQMEEIIRNRDFKHFRLNSLYRW